MKPLVLLMQAMPAELMMALEADYTVVHAHELNSRPGDEFLLPEVRVVVTGGGTGIPNEWLDRLPSLGLIAVFGVGIDRIDIPLATRRGIRVRTTQGVLTDDVADLALALMLASMRRLVEGDRHVRGGSWVRGESLVLGRDLRGKTVGVLGLGAILKAVGHRAAAFGMDIAYWNRSPVQSVCWRQYETPAALAAASDVLVVCVAAAPETARIVDRDVIYALGPKGLPVNVARGSVVDESAMFDALSEGALGCRCTRCLRE